MVHIARKFGIETLENMICAVLVSKMELFIPRLRMNDTQIRFFVETFIEDFKDESVSDLSVCLTKWAKGVHGEVKFEITPSRVREWFTLHLNDKAQHREKVKKAESFGSDKVHPKFIEVFKSAISKPKESTDDRNSRRDQYINSIDKLIDQFNKKDLDRIKKEMLHFGYDEQYPETFKRVTEKLTGLKN